MLSTYSAVIDRTSGSEVFFDISKFTSTPLSDAAGCIDCEPISHSIHSIANEPVSAVPANLRYDEAVGRIYLTYTSQASWTFSYKATFALDTHVWSTLGLHTVNIKCASDVLS